MTPIKLLDCTLRDGGYYNNWDFPPALINEYLRAMAAAAVDYVELGFRSLDRQGFRGACAFTTDDFISTLDVPPRLRVGVMVNASELVGRPEGPQAAAALLFRDARDSPVDLVRIACHVHEFEEVLPVCGWLKERGYEVGINLMQVADRSRGEIAGLARAAAAFPVDALYFADSMGSLDPDRTAGIVAALREGWQGEIGIHTHDNMGLALSNTMRAIGEGATWIDSTVTGMGRGPGNAQTEYVVLELADRRGVANIAPLLALVRNTFKPMQQHYGWGTNPYYYLAGKHGIHPTFIQEMMSDPRYGDAEMLSVIEHLLQHGGKKFTARAMEDGRQLYGGEAGGTWTPSRVIEGRDVLLLGAGPTAAAHREAVERHVRKHAPFVIALNTQSPIDAALIDVRVACHPFRLLADRDAYACLPQPLVVSASRLPEMVRDSLRAVELLDFGLEVKPGAFMFGTNSAVIPASLAAAYALAIAASGKAARVLLAGFDGYGPEDPRAVEMDELFALFHDAEGAVPVLAITPTRYAVPATSVYAL
jgi:4-hydroxy 2-oxovalerate aldolase